MTSHDCIYAVRRLTGIRRIGHTGTLDPNAEGVLPICIGTCARIAEYTDLDMKTYDCTMKLGIVTDTQDIWGEVLCDKSAALADGSITVTEEMVRAAFAPLSGSIDQYPPKYSAVRYGGRRLYEYARAGQEIEIRPRRVYIKKIDIKEINLEDFTIRFIVTCGKGTYIRAICNDVGETLGCGAAMTALTRTRSGKFDISEAVTIDYLRELTARKEEPETEDIVNGLLYTPDYPLEFFGKAVIRTAERSRWFINGGHIRFSETKLEKEPVYKHSDAPFEIRAEYRDAYCVYGYADEESEGTDDIVFLGVAFYNYDYKKLVADKIFRRNNEDF